MTRLRACTLAFATVTLMTLALPATLGVPPARAVDVSDLSDFEANPCVIALGERNVAQHTDAPDSELVDACDRAHGSVEVAWDVLTRTWRPRMVPLGPVASGRLGPGLAGLALLQMLLAYAVLGGPLPGLEGFLQQPGGVAAGAAGARRRAVEAGLCLVLRLAAASLLLRLLALEGVWAGVLAAACAAALLAVVAAMRWAAARRWAPLSPEPPGPPPSAAALLLASLANDLAARAPGLLALALLARGTWRLLALGVLLSILASLPAALRALRALRRAPWAMLAIGVALALSLGQIAASDPALGRLFGPTSSMLAIGLPALFAALAGLGGAGLGGKLRPGGRGLLGG